MTNETTYDVWQDPIVLAAFALMQDAHRNHALSPDPKLGGQRRKYSGEHYEVHPIQVAKIISRSIHSSAITIAVALLHDVDEDTTRNGSHIGAAMAPFGTEVAQLVIYGVSQVTDVSRPEDGNRAARKELDKLHAWKCEPAQQSIKLADILSNMQSIVKHDPGFARKWVKEKEDMLPGLSEGDPKLFAAAVKMFAAYHAREDVKMEGWDIV